MNGIYINLKERVDRKEHFERFVKSNLFFSNIKHMDAIKHLYPYSATGCSMSHLAILKMFENTNDPYITIMEDDFFILDQNNFNAFVKDFESIKNSKDWNIIVFTPSGNSVNSTPEMSSANFKRIITIK
jgi:GR25 family glycosyltransferase involved in LPS biosynthesis